MPGCSTPQNHRFCGHNGKVLCDLLFSQNQPLKLADD